MRPSQTITLRLEVDLEPLQLLGKEREQYEALEQLREIAFGKSSDVAGGVTNIPGSSDTSDPAVGGGIVTPFTPQRACRSSAHCCSCVRTAVLRVSRAIAGWSTNRYQTYSTIDPSFRVVVNGPAAQLAELHGDEPVTLSRGIVPRVAAGNVWSVSHVRRGTLSRATARHTPSSSRR